MSLAGSHPRTPGASSLMAASLSCPCAGPGASQCAASSLLLFLLLLHPARGVAMAHRHPNIKGIALSRDVGRTPLGGVGSGPCGSSVLTVFAALPALETLSLAFSPSPLMPSSCPSPMLPFPPCPGPVSPSHLPVACPCMAATQTLCPSPLSLWPASRAGEDHRGHGCP